MPQTFPAPDHGLVVAFFLTVRDVAVSREFYANVFGGEVVPGDPVSAFLNVSQIVMADCLSRYERT
jgi:hypothetical protein